MFDKDKVLRLISFSFFFLFGNLLENLGGDPSKSKNLSEKSKG